MPHTPGPWKAQPFVTPKEDDDPMMVYEVIAGDLQERFDNLRTDENDEYNPEEVAAIHAENEANAHLLAAAPELLAALKRILACNDYCFASPEMDYIRVKVTGEFSEALKEAQRALAKAENRT